MKQDTGTAKYIAVSGALLIKNNGAITIVESGKTITIKAPAEKVFSYIS